MRSDSRSANAVRGRDCTASREEVRVALAIVRGSGGGASEERMSLERASLSAEVAMEGAEERDKPCCCWVSSGEAEEDRRRREDEKDETEEIRRRRSIDGSRRRGSPPF